MIVRNECENLDACLASVAGLADEIIVIDTGSTDDTRGVAAKRGASVYEFAWVDDFSAARNESIKHASGEWIFWLDADDRVPEHSYEKLKSLIGSLPESNAAFLMTVVSPAPDGRPMFEALHARLFRNDARIRWEYPVHEQIAASVRRSGGELRRTDIGIVHVGYLQSTSVSHKLERNLRIMDKSLEEKPLDGFMLSCRAGTLADLGRSAEALVSLNLCELAHTGYVLPPSIPALKGRSYAMQGDLFSALESVRVGLGKYPRDAKLLFMEAEILAALGEAVEAERCIRGQLVVGEEHEPFACADRTIVAFRARHLLADLLLLGGRYEEAEREARQVTEDRAGFGLAWLTLAESLLAQGRIDEVKPIWDWLEKSKDGAIGHCFLKACLYRHMEEPELALATVDEGLSAHPGAVILMRAKVRVLLESGKRGPDLAAVVDRVLEVDPMCMRAWSVRRACWAPLSEGPTRWSDRARTATGPIV
jgi:tetratricopeptide (TPR) repeat protein